VEEINMFEMHLSPVQKIFNRNGFDEPEFSKTYTCIIKNKKIIGELIAYDDDVVIFGNVWVIDSDKPGYYDDQFSCCVSEVLQLNAQQNFDFEVGQPFRAELYIRNEQTDRPTTWVSCFYRGQTHSGKIMLSIIGKKAKVLLLDKADIKGFFQLSLDDVAIAENCDSNE